MQISYLWRLLGTHLVPILSVAFFVQRMAARPGRGCSTKMKIPAASMWHSILIMPILFLLLCGKPVARRGVSPAADREADFTVRVMVAALGSGLKSMDCQKDRTAESAWQ